MTYNHPQSSKDSAELARWLWPYAVNLDWDGRVTVKRPDGDWDTFSPLTNLSHCLRALPVLRDRRLMSAFLQEFEIQLHKLRRVKPRVGVLPEEDAPEPASEQEVPKLQHNILEYPAWLKDYVLSLGVRLSEPDVPVDDVKESSGAEESSEPQEKRPKKFKSVSAWLNNVIRKVERPSLDSEDRDEEKAKRAWVVLRASLKNFCDDDSNFVDEVLRETAEEVAKHPDKKTNSLWLLAIAMGKRRGLERQREIDQEKEASERVSLVTFPGLCASAMVLLEQLHPDQQTALLLHRMMGKTQAEVASELGIKPAAVGRLLEQADIAVKKGFRERFGAHWRKAVTKRPVTGILDIFSFILEERKTAAVKSASSSAANRERSKVAETEKDRCRQDQRNEDTALFVSVSIKKMGGGPKVASLIASWLKFLPASQQSVFLLRYFANLQAKEIGVTLQISVNQVERELRGSWCCIEKVLRQSAVHAVLLAQILSALLIVARDDISQMRGEA